MADLRPLLYRGWVAPRRLCLLRIHKTGSRSFRAAFGACYFRAQHGPVGTAAAVRPEDFATARFAAPHMALATWQEMRGPAADWVTAVTLREPRARLRSAFRYFRGYRDDHPTGTGRLLRGLDYHGFLTAEAPEIVALRDNVMARFLGGGAFGPGETGRNKLYLPEGLDIAEAAARACAALDDGEVVPVVLERPEASISALAAHIGLRRAPPLPWENRTGAAKAAVPLGEGYEAAEEAAIRHDRAVYAAALAALER